MPRSLLQRCSQVHRLGQARSLSLQRAPQWPPDPGRHILWRARPGRSLLLMSLATLSTRSWSREETTPTPPAANRSAMAWPIPVEDPVTVAVSPAIRNSSVVIRKPLFMVYRVEYKYIPSSRRPLELLTMDLRGYSDIGTLVVIHSD